MKRNSCFLILFSASLAGSVMLARGGIRAEYPVKNVPAAVPAYATVTRLHDVSQKNFCIAPIVLWSGAEPSAVITAKENDLSDPRRIIWRLDYVNKTQGRSRAPGGPFPMTIEAVPPRGKDDYNLLNILDAVMTADIDGDGSEELVTVRRFGGVMVASQKRVLFESPSADHPEIASYRLTGCQRAVVNRRDTLFLWFERSQARGDLTDSARAGSGAAEPFKLLRIDATGINGISVSDPVTKASSFAVLIAPDGGFDALAVFGFDEKTGLVASIHDSTGRRTGGPWNMNVPYAYRFDKIMTLPGRRLAAASMGDYWKTHIWMLDLSEKGHWGGCFEINCKSMPVDIITDAPETLVLLANQAQFCAFDRQGRLWSRQDSAWVRLSEPRCDAASEESGSGEYEFSGVYPGEDGSGDLLIVQTRPHHFRRLTHEDLVAAAERYLTPIEVSDLRVLIASKGADGERMFDREVTDRLTWPLRHPESLNSARYRQPESFRAWLADNDLRAETVFTIIRKGRPSLTFRAPGYHDTGRQTSLQLPLVSWRGSNDRVSVALSLRLADASGNESENLHLCIVQAPAKR